jgi:hypothetical protein
MIPDNSMRLDLAETMFVLKDKCDAMLDRAKMAEEQRDRCLGYIDAALDALEKGGGSATVIADVYTILKQGQANERPR